MRVKLFVAATVLAAVAATACAAVYVPAGPRHGGWPEAVALGALVLFAEFTQLKFRYRQDTVAYNLLAAIAVPLVVAQPGLVAAGTLALALLASNFYLRNAVIKTVFNASQWTLLGASASLLLHVMPTDSPAALLGSAVALLPFMELANSAIIGLLLVTIGAGQGAKPAVVGMAVSALATLTAGVCLIAAYLVSPWTLPLGFIFIGGMHAFGEAQSSLRADHQRLQTMQAATHHLASSVDQHSALPKFIEAVRAGFEVTAVDLVMTTRAGQPEVFRCRLQGTAPVSSAGRSPYPLFDDLGLATAVEPVYVDARAGTGTGAGTAAESLAAHGHSRVLAAPLRSGGETVGALLLFDRSGVEGFEDGEKAVVSALARELVGFIERVALTAAIDEERRKLADIIDSTSDGIFTLTREGLITSWNAGFAAMTGYSAEEMVGTRHFGLLRPRDVLGRDLQLELWLGSAEQTATTELQMRTADGAIAWLSCSCSRLPAADGRDTLVVVARNVTQARELERLKDDFVAIVSHELRTPLVPIRGWAQTLLNRGDRLSEEQRRSAVQSILSQSQKLESLVLNILEASRIEAGQADLGDVVDISAICARVVEDMTTARPERTVRFRPPRVPSQVRGSTVWAERAVANLVANAVKYSPDDEPVDVTVDVDPHAREVLVAVTDRGPGIPEESHERIFARFERLEKTRKQTGTGLGLYITRRMARAMGGEVSVSSMPGAGSTFVLRLPLQPTTVELDVPRPRQHPHPHQQPHPHPLPR